MATAMQRAEAAFAALGECAKRADAAMWADRGKFDPAYRNLCELRFYYRWVMHHQREDAAVYRRQVRRAIKVYRHHHLAETRGIDTSAHGWRGGRAA